MLTVCVCVCARALASSLMHYNWALWLFFYLYWFLFIYFYLVFVCFGKISLPAEDCLVEVFHVWVWNMVSIAEKCVHYCVDFSYVASVWYWIMTLFPQILLCWLDVCVYVNMCLFVRVCSFSRNICERFWWIFYGSKTNTHTHTHTHTHTVWSKKSPVKLKGSIFNVNTLPMLKICSQSAYCLHRW